MFLVLPMPWRILLTLALPIGLPDVIKLLEFCTEHFGLTLKQDCPHETRCLSQVWLETAKRGQMSMKRLKQGDPGTYVFTTFYLTNQLENCLKRLVSQSRLVTLWGRSIKYLKPYFGVWFTGVVALIRDIHGKCMAHLEPENLGSVMLGAFENH